MPIVEDMLENVNAQSPKVIAGDFDEQAFNRRSKENEEKYQRVLKAFAQLDIVLVNEVIVNIFRKGEFYLLC